MNFLKKFTPNNGSSSSRAEHTATNKHQGPEVVPRGRTRTIAIPGGRSVKFTTGRSEGRVRSISPARTIRSQSQAQRDNRSSSPTDTIRPSLSIKSRKDESVNEANQKRVVTRQNGESTDSLETEVPAISLDDLKESGVLSGSQIPFPSLTALAIAPPVKGTWSPPEGILSIQDDIDPTRIWNNAEPAVSSHFTASDFEIIIDFPATGSDVTYWDEDDSEKANIIKCIPMHIKVFARSSVRWSDVLVSFPDLGEIGIKCGANYVQNKAYCNPKPYEVNYNGSTSTSGKYTTKGHRITPEHGICIDPKLRPVQQEFAGGDVDSEGIMEGILLKSWIPMPMQYFRARDASTFTVEAKISFLDKDGVEADWTLSAHRNLTVSHLVAVIEMQ